MIGYQWQYNYKINLLKSRLFYISNIMYIIAKKFVSVVIFFQIVSASMLMSQIEYIEFGDLPG